MDDFRVCVVLVPRIILEIKIEWHFNFISRVFKLQRVLVYCTVIVHVSYTLEYEVLISCKRGVTRNLLLVGARQVLGGSVAKLEI